MQAVLQPTAALTVVFMLLCLALLGSAMGQAARSGEAGAQAEHLQARLGRRLRPHSVAAACRQRHPGGGGCAGGAAVRRGAEALQQLASGVEGGAQHLCRRHPEQVVDWRQGSLSAGIHNRLDGLLILMCLALGCRLRQ